MLQHSSLIIFLVSTLALRSPEIRDATKTERIFFQDFLQLFNFDQFFLLDLSAWWFLVSLLFNFNSTAQRRVRENNWRVRFVVHLSAHRNKYCMFFWIKLNVNLILHCSIIIYLFSSLRYFWSCQRPLASILPLRVVYSQLRLLSHKTSILQTSVPLERNPG